MKSLRHRRIGSILLAAVLVLVTLLGTGLFVAGAWGPEPDAVAEQASESASGLTSDSVAAAAARAAEAEVLADARTRERAQARVAKKAARAASRLKAEKRAAKKAAKKAARAESRADALPGEVWRRADEPYRENDSNPLANRVWGVYSGAQDQVSVGYARASAGDRALLDTIMLRPRTKWFGSFVPDSQIRGTVAEYIAGSQGGDSKKLVQFAVFRMEPWEHEACGRRSSPAELGSYRRWIDEMAAGVGSTPALIVMQPDGPFLWCAPDREAKATALSYATQKLSALPNTSVYIDAGAPDWCENDRGGDPERCAQILKETGVQYARGFALDSTHYTGPTDNIRHGSRIVEILKRDGYGSKHFILDTAKSGSPTEWDAMIPSAPGGLKDDARVCVSSSQEQCVTLGIPPTVRVSAPQWGLSVQDRELARKNVDGFVWFGRPWLYKQADPFVMDRALTMARSTPWPIRR